MLMNPPVMALDPVLELDVIVILLVKPVRLLSIAQAACRPQFDVATVLRLLALLAKTG